MIPIHVLIVDDSVTMRAMLEQVISSDAGCHVVGVAADADAARRLMMDSRPDVMTLDLAMPGIAGLQFLHDIQNQRHPPIIVVSSSSKAGACETEQAFEAGAFDCFDKARLLSDVPKFMRALKKAARCTTTAVRRPTRRVEKVQISESAAA